MIEKDNIDPAVAAHWGPNAFGYIFVSKEEVYYDAVGTFKALGIVSSEDNLFTPESYITVAYANDILDKLSIPINFNFDDKYELSKQDMAKLILNITSN